MDKIVIRKKIIDNINSKIIQLDESFNTIEDIIFKYDIDYILINLFGEEQLSYDMLMDEYYKFIDTGISEIYTYMYVLDNEYGLSIDNNINLYKINSKVNNSLKQYLPWIYVEGKRYVGDSWWFDDVEICRDIKSISFVEFIKKYKGF